MNRRVPLAVVSVVMAMGLLVLAASSGPVRVWVTPSPVRSPSDASSDPAPVPVRPRIPAASDRSSLPSWTITWLPLVGVLLLALVALAVVGVRVVRPFQGLGWRGLRRWWTPLITPLPEVTERELTVDMEAALAALATGSPRNAIVACWMQLERDAAKVGLPRMVAETPAEYVARVVGSSSVDPAPINELAALYREARFSRHKLHDADRQRALDTLRRVEAMLRHKQRVLA